MTEVENGRFTPARSGALVVSTQYGLVGRSRSNACPNHRLNAIDEPALNHRITPVHAECNGLLKEFLFG